MRPALLLLALLIPAAPAQWTLQQSNTTASLRGIHAVTSEIAWASGTSGTVLHTTDGGAHWLPCATPPAAEHLDFRGVQAFDAQTAIVMSSGKGDLSRLYKTTDSCQTWTLIFTNPDPEGFWDGLQTRDLRPSRTDGKFWIKATLIGDPVDGKFPIFVSFDGEHWLRGSEATAASAKEGESLFAASNSALSCNGSGCIFATGGKAGSRSRVESEDIKHDPHVSWKWVGGDIPLATSESAGAFSVASSHVDKADQLSQGPQADRVYFADMKAIYVVVGGDYKKPDKANGTAAHSTDGGLHWTAATTPPHGYRSAVAYNPTQKSWITVGPNGTDLSTDDGRNWHPLRPAPTDAPDADRNWNALSLPFVVGPGGRIGHLNPLP